MITSAFLYKFLYISTLNNILIELNYVHTNINDVS